VPVSGHTYYNIAPRVKILDEYPGLSPLALSAPPTRYGCHSDLAQYSHTPILPPVTLRVAMRAGHHSARPDSRTSTKRLVGADGRQQLPHVSAWACNSSKVTNSKVEACVAFRSTGGAAPASNASCQRVTQRHQRSPSFNPGKSPCGVTKSLPRE
jgi:hypothetical protein